MRQYLPFALASVAVAAGVPASVQASDPFTVGMAGDGPATVEALEAVWDGSQYLVAWSELHGDDSVARVARVSAAGDVLDAVPLDIPGMQLAIASNGSSGLTLVSAPVGAVDLLYAQPIERDGSLGERVRLGNWPLHGARLATDGDGYLAVMQSNDYALFGLKLGPDGKPRGSRFEIRASEHAYLSRVHWTGSSYWVIWMEEFREVPTLGYYAANVTPQGEVSEPKLIVDYLSGGHADTACAGEQCVAIWWNIDVESGAAEVQRYDGAGNAVGEITVFPDYPGGHAHWDGEAFVMAATGPSFEQLTRLWPDGRLERGAASPGADPKLTYPAIGANGNGQVLLQVHRDDSVPVTLQLVDGPMLDQPEAGDAGLPDGGSPVPDAGSADDADDSPGQGSSCSVAHSTRNPSALWLLGAALAFIWRSGARRRAREG